MKPRNQPLINEYLTHRTPKNVSLAQNLQKEIAASYRASHMSNTGKKKSEEFQSKPPLDLTRQASSGRLSGAGTRSNKNLVIENKVLTPQSSTSKIEYRNYFNHGIGNWRSGLFKIQIGSFVEVSSPKASIPTEKAKSKSLNKAVSDQGFCRINFFSKKSPKSKQEENNLKAVPKISKNSNLIFKNSKRAKEDEELKHKLTHSKHNSNGS